MGAHRNKLAVHAGVLQALSSLREISGGNLKRQILHLAGPFSDIKFIVCWPNRQNVAPDSWFKRGNWNQTLGP
ncbi:hypothetical protein TWF694_001240 [Orbilia ellipsospora]|uniref:Uncharacterized protein n=1 Tax=Orbilia ellipsospora TaxID=2528407 RepID=A0AAV9XR25_9PEZI